MAKRVCFVCHGEVPIENDGGEIGFKVFGDFSGMHCGSRTIHFLPVVGDDRRIICRGSPYRAQYIDGQPRDLRKFIYFKTREAQIRDAYQKLQELAKKEKNHPASA